MCVCVGGGSIVSPLSALLDLAPPRHLAHHTTPHPHTKSNPKQPNKQASAAPSANATSLAATVAAPPLCTPDLVSSRRWGVATAAYQVEGAWNASGRTPSVWDTFSHNGRVDLDQSGDVACDHYHKYPQDFALMRRMGIKHYRFSFSWNRLFPQGKAGTPINPEGVQ